MRSSKALILGLLFGLFATSAFAANRFGVCAATCTWDGSSTAMWSTSSGGATGASVPGIADAVIFDANTCVGGITCTITVNTNFTITSLTMGACTASTTGCILDFSANNNSPTIGNGGTGSFSVSGTGTRTLNLGAGTFTFASGASWTASVATNLTFHPGTSTILYSGVSTGNRTFVTGGLTYATVTFDSNTGAGGIVVNGGSATFTTLNINPPNLVDFTAGQTYTVTNSITWSGTTTKQLLIQSNADINATIAQGAANAAMTWATFWRITMTGAGTHVATNSFNARENVGITITPPSAIGSGGACILGGWLLWRDFDSKHMNDNFPAFLDKAA